MPSILPADGGERNTTAVGQIDPAPSSHEAPVGSLPAETANTGVVQGDDAPQSDFDVPPAQQLFAVINGEQQAIEPSDLTDDARRLLLKRRCEQAEELVTIQAVEFFALTQALRFLLFKFVKELGDDIRLQIGDDQEENANVFEAVVAAFPIAVSAEAQIAAQHAAIEAAALFLAAEDWPAAANTITNDLTCIGTHNIAAPGIFRAIRTVAGIDPNKPGLDDLASHFHGCLQIEMRTPAGEPALRYFRDDFYTWNGRTWLRVDDKEFKARITKHLQANAPRDVGETLVNNVILNLKGQTLLNAGQLQLPFWIESESPLVTRTPPLVVFQNGIVDITPETDYEEGWRLPPLYPHDTRCFSAVMLPYDYDPAAICPLWQQTLDEIFPQERGGDNRIAVLQEFMGLTLFPNQMRHEKFLIAVGHGANGKSTVLRVWEQMLGSNNVSHATLEAIAKDSHLYAMLGKLANIASDMKRMEKTEEGRLKMLVSGEPIQVDRKYKSALTMVPTARLIFATNELPPINDRSDGIWRRMIAMPFNRQFGEGERDLTRSDRLLTELPGIFNWALGGAVRLFEQGGFSHCRVCEHCAGEHRQHSDSFLEFWEEMVEVKTGNRVSTDDFYRAYVLYCQNNGRHHKHNAEIGKQVLRQPGVTKVRLSSGSRKYEYHGVGLLPAPRLPFSPVSSSRIAIVPLPSNN